MFSFMRSGLKSSVGNADDWTQKLLRLKLDALVKTGRDQDADEALQILAQVQFNVLRHCIAVL